MKCEICGKEIFGSPTKIIIDTAELLVCKDCAKFGTIKKKEKQNKKVILKGFTQKERVRAKLIPFEDIDLVSDYHIRIKKKREKIGLSITQLAKIIKEKESWLRKIESGRVKPPLKVVRKIEKALDIKLLVSEQIEPSRPEMDKSKKALTLGDIIEFKKKR